jgi:hypothetical protein
MRQTTLDPMFSREHPEVASLLRLVYDEVFQGPPPAAWIQIEYREGQGSSNRWYLLENGARLSSSDKYRITLRAPDPVYFYVFQIDTHGQVEWVFPENSYSRYSTGANPVSADKTVKVPEGETTMFFLDDRTGVEHIYVVATAKRWTTLENKLAALCRRLGTSASRGGVVDAPFGLKLRGIGGIASDSGDDSRPVSGLQGVLAEEVWFYHVQPKAD